MGRAGTLRFTDAAPIAILRVRKFASLLKDPGGRWRSFVVLTPTGERHNVYADVDKNRATIRGETLARRLSRFLQDKGIGGAFRNRMQDCCVSNDWIPFARIMDLTTDGFRIQWNLEAVRDLQLDKDALTRGFVDLSDPQAQVSWG